MSVDTSQIKRPNGLSLLCLDADGARALSQLLILADIMLAWEMNTDPDSGPIPPREVFDVICGVGVGGLVAIFLVIFGMTTQEAMEALLSIGKDILDEDSSYALGVNKSKRTAKLREMARQLMERHQLRLDTRLLDVECYSTGCKLIVPITLKENTGAMPLLRNYQCREPPLDTTVIDAILATCADPTTFEPVSIERNGMKQTYVSGASILPNPVRELIGEAYSHFGGDMKVASLLSLGAGYSEVISVPSSSGERHQFLEKMIADAERIAQETQSQMERLPLYTRLSVKQGLQDVPLDNWRFEEKVRASTRQYLEDYDIEIAIDNIIESMGILDGSSTLEQLRYSGGGLVAAPEMPPLTTHFVERTGPMAALVECMTNSDSLDDQKLAVVSGLGGCGKTTLVLKYVTDYRHRYRSVFFIDGGVQDSNYANKASRLEGARGRIRSRLTQYVRSLGPEYSQVSFEDALSYLSQVDDGERLLVFDNIDDPELNIESYLPNNLYTSIIITTRDPDRGQLASTNPIELDVMSPEEAVSLLLRTTRRESIIINQDGAYRVAETLGWHPLALVQAGSYIVQTRVSWDAYLRVYAESRPRLMAQTVRNHRGMRYESAYAALDASYEALPTQARHFLHLLSFFHRVDFPLEIIRSGAENEFKHEFYTYSNNQTADFHDGVDRLEEIFLANGRWTEFNMDSLLTALQNYSFISITETSFTRLLHSHSLVYTWAYDRIPEDDIYAYKSAAVRLLAGGCVFDAGPVNQYISTHVMHLSPLWDDLHINDKGSFASTLYCAGSFEAAVKLEEQVLDLIKQTMPDAPLKIAFAANQLAYSFQEARNYSAAVELREEVLKIREEHLGETHVDTIAALANLGLTYFNMGRLADACELEEKVLRLREELLGEQSLDTISASANLAVTYYKLGKHRKGLELEEKVLRMRKELLGGQHLQTVNASASLGSTYYDLGRWEEAAELLEGVFSKRKDVLGIEHVHTIWAADMLALTYHKLERHWEAEELQVIVLAVRRETLGDDHDDTIKAMGHLANTYTCLGRQSDAVALRTEIRRFKGRDQDSLSDDEDVEEMVQILYGLKKDTLDDYDELKRGMTNKMKKEGSLLKKKVKSKAQKLLLYTKAAQDILEPGEFQEGSKKFHAALERWFDS